MSRGLGRVQRECLRVIEAREAAGTPSTTFNVVAEVYQIKRDRHGNRMCTDAQHTAVKRALAALKRKGLVRGQQASAQCDDGSIILARCDADGRAVRSCYWSTPAQPDLKLGDDPGYAKSNVRIASEIGVSVSTVRRAREK